MSGEKHSMGSFHDFEEGEQYSTVPDAYAEWCESVWDEREDLSDEAVIVPVRDIIAALRELEKDANG